MSNELDLSKTIDKILEKAPEGRHSYYQLKYFVLGKEPTTQSRMWQCLRELQSRKETIENLQLQIADLNDDLELLKIDENEETFRYSDEEREVTRRDIKIRKVKRKKESILKSLDTLTKKLNFVNQEARFFTQAFEALEKIEPLKDFDDFEAQQEYWETKITEEINLRMLTQQPLSVDLIKTTLALPPESIIKQNMVKMLEDSRKCLEIKISKDLNEITSKK